MLEILTEEEQKARDKELENNSNTKKTKKTKKVKNPYKCQIQGIESYIDNQFVIFSQSYLMNAIIDFNKGKSFPVNRKGRINVLDLGCYNGRVMHFLTQLWTFVNYTGVDIRQDYLDRSVVARRSDVKLLCEDVTKGLSVPDESQNIIVSSEVIEHIHAEYLEDTLRVLYKKLAPGGRLVVAFPMNTKEKQFHFLEKEVNLGHVNFPVHDDFIALAQIIGYKFTKFDSGFSLKSKYRIPKKIKMTKEFQRIRNMLGTHVARAYAMTIDDEHTGGGYYTFDKPS
jgi:SAM-dependent methyltransferase